MRIAYLRRRLSTTQKSMDVHHPHSEVVGITVNPDKSRPCLTHRRLRLILRIKQLSKFPTFQSVPNNSKRLLYLPTKIIPPPCTQGTCLSKRRLRRFSSTWLQKYKNILNIIFTRANRTWKDVDQKALKELQSQLTDQNTLYMYLTEAQRYAVEEFVGQLPPYTKFNNFVYRMSQMGLTAVENTHAK